MEKFLFEPRADSLGFGPLVWLSDPFQRTVQADPHQMRLYCEARAVRIGIAPLRPELPTFLGRREPRLAQGMELPKVPWSATLYQGDHLARQVGIWLHHAVLEYLFAA